MGTDASSATATSQIVPTRAGKMPPAVIPSLGSVKRKSDGDDGSALVDQDAEDDDDRQDQQDRHQEERGPTSHSTLSIADVELGGLEHGFKPYFLRIPRTTRSAVRLMMKVMRNRKIPSVKRAR